MKSWSWYDDYSVDTSDRWNDMESQEVETLTVSKQNDTYYCENCYSKLQHDGFANGHAQVVMIGIVITN